LSTGANVKRVIATKSAAAMYNPVSQATLAPNGMLYTAGMIGRSPETGRMLASFDDQANQALRNLGALLREAGGRQYFSNQNRPRALYQPLKLYPGALVMFTAVACVVAGPA